MKFDITYPWDGEIELLQGNSWIGQILTSIPESVEYHDILVYPYITKARILSVTTCELLEDEAGYLWLHLEGETTKPIKLRATPSKYYAWQLIVVPVDWISTNLEKFYSMFKRGDTVDSLTETKTRPFE
jgi:hypothetical protein